MVIQTIFCDYCGEYQAAVMLKRKPWCVCSGCDEEEFNRLLGRETKLPRIVQPSKGEY